VRGTIVLLFSNIYSYREGEFVIDKTKMQLPGYSLPAELPIILHENIPCVHYLTQYLFFLKNLLSLQVVPLHFSSQRQDIIMLS